MWHLCCKYKPQRRRRIEFCRAVYIKDNKRLFRTAIENAATLQLDNSYSGLFRHVFAPILERYGVSESDRIYIMTFYISGLMAIITEWLKNDCTDSSEHIIEIMQKCIPK